MNELFTKYFKWNGEIIHGYKLVEINGLYTLKVWTSCKKLGNWQEFFRNYSLERLINYFKKNVKQDEIERAKNHSNRDERAKKWCDLEDKWRKDTLEALLEISK